MSTITLYQGYAEKDGVDKQIHIVKANKESSMTQPYNAVLLVFGKRLVIDWLQPEYIDEPPFAIQWITLPPGFNRFQILV